MDESSEDEPKAGWGDVGDRLGGDFEGRDFPKSFCAAGSVDESPEDEPKAGWGDVGDRLGGDFEGRDSSRHTDIAESLGGADIID